MAKKRTSDSSAFSRKAVDTTVIIVTLVSFVIATVVVLLVAMPKSRATTTLQTEIDDYTQSTADLTARLGAAQGGQVDPTTAKLQQLQALQERLTIFNHSLTPTTQVLIAGAPGGVSYKISVLTAAGIAPTGVVSPDDFYGGTGQGEYVRYSLSVTANSLSELVAFSQAVQDSPKLMQIVNPRITYTPTSQTGSITEVGGAMPWSLSGELWVWGRQDTQPK